MDDTAPAPAVPQSFEPNRAEPDAPALRREIVILRARCSNLRSWARTLLDDPAARAEVPDLFAREPALSESEANDLIGALVRGGPVPAHHPLCPATADARALTDTATELRAEHERLRAAFFALHDRLYPNDIVTEEYMLAQRDGPMFPMAEVLAELEREFGEPR